MASPSICSWSCARRSGSRDCGPTISFGRTSFASPPRSSCSCREGSCPAVIERWLRVYGDSLRRIAETEADWWHTEIEVPHLTSGLDEAETMEAAARWGDEMTSVIQQALLAVYHAQQEHAWTDVFITDVEGVL